MITFLILIFIFPPFDANSESLRIKDEIHRLAKKWKLANSGIALINLKNRKMYHQNGHKYFSPASTIKVVLMIQIYRMIQARQLNINKWVRIKSENVTETYDFSKHDRPVLKSGQRANISQLLNLMISKSDNIATNTLLDFVDRDDMNQFLKELGLMRTRFNRKLTGGVLIVKDRGYENMFNRTTPVDMARLLSYLTQYKLANRKYTRQMLSILGRQMDRTKIPARLPKSVRSYNKTGVNSLGTSDIAILRNKSVNYVLTVYTPYRDKKANALIAGFSKDIYQLMLKI